MLYYKNIFVRKTYNIAHYNIVQHKEACSRKNAYISTSYLPCVMCTKPLYIHTPAQKRTPVETHSKSDITVVKNTHTYSKQLTGSLLVLRLISNSQFTKLECTRSKITECVLHWEQHLAYLDPDRCEISTEQLQFNSHFRS